MCVCVCVAVQSHMIWCCIYHLSFFSQGSSTLLRLRVPEQRHASSLQMPPGEEGEGGGSDTSVPLSERRLFHWRRPLLGGIRRLAMTLTQSPLTPLLPPQCMHASARLPIIPLLQITSHFHGQLQTKQQITCWSVCSSCQPRCEFYTFVPPADRTEATVSIMKPSYNVLHYMCMDVLIRRRGRGACCRIHVLCVYRRVAWWWQLSFSLAWCVYSLLLTAP